ncbi:MAG TPA: hypothetical protein PKH51_11560, partial [Candidatus Sumerlaeota bacterium]|nr:hypothetical protein [Candidatus Sumerlaeota bacterium]
GEELVVAGLTDPREDRVGGRPVHVLEEDLLPVDRDDEGNAAVVVGLLEAGNRADAELARAAI